MGVLEWLKERADKLVAALQEFGSEHHFLEAAMAASALMTAADGVIRTNERVAMLKFVRQSPALQHLDTETVVAGYERYADALAHDLQTGRRDCFQALDRLESEEEKDAVLHLACAIGAADGDFDPHERKTAREIATYLGLDPNCYRL